MKIFKLFILNASFLFFPEILMSEPLDYSGTNAVCLNQIDSLSSKVEIENVLECSGDERSCGQILKLHRFYESNNSTGANIKIPIWWGRIKPLVKWDDRLVDGEEWQSIDSYDLFNFFHGLRIATLSKSTSWKRHLYENLKTMRANIALNLANRNTIGYKKLATDSLNSTNLLLAENVLDNTSINGSILSDKYWEGAIKVTENQFDISIEGDGFFQYQRLDKSLVYSRDGRLGIGENRKLINRSTGNSLVPSIIVPVGIKRMEIAMDGKVFGIAGDSKSFLGKIIVADFLNRSGLDTKNGYLFTATNSSGPPIALSPNDNGTGGIAQGQLESSNVNTVEEIVNLIRAATIASYANENFDAVKEFGQSKFDLTGLGISSHICNNKSL